MSQRKLNRMMTTRLAVGLGLALALTATACDPDPLYMECNLSSSILDACEARDDDDDFTCVVKEHPTCLENICASYQDQPSICTKSCNEDASEEECSCQCYAGVAVHGLLLSAPEMTCTWLILGSADVTLGNAGAGVVRNDSHACVRWGECKLWL